jgi:hypothetical protein
VKVRFASAVLKSLKRCAYILSVYILHRTVIRYHLRTHTCAKPISSKSILGWSMSALVEEQSDFPKRPALSKSKTSRKKEDKIDCREEKDKTCTRNKAGKKRRKHVDDTLNLIDPGLSTSTGKSAASVHPPNTNPSHESSIPACVTTQNQIDDAARKDEQNPLLDELIAIVEFLSGTLQSTLKNLRDIDDSKRSGPPGHGKDSPVFEHTSTHKG